MFIRCTRSEKHSKCHCGGDEKRINNDGRNIKLIINNIIKVSAKANAINNNKWMVRLRSFRQVGPNWIKAVRAQSVVRRVFGSESPYSVRIRLIFDSSNPLVNRLGPNIDNTFF